MNRSALSAPVLAGLALLLPCALLAQEADTAFSVTEEDIEAARTAPLFQSHEYLEFTISADFETMRDDDRVDDAEERPATITFAGPDGTPQTYDLQVRTRGIFRLRSRNCQNPPIRLNLRTSAMAGTVFEGQDKLKLVGVCRTRQDYYEQYVLQEYLIYRTYNQLTDVGFQVRPVRVTYVDTSDDVDTFTKYGFLIEDEEAMSARNGARSVEWPPGPGQLLGKYAQGSNQLLPQAHDPRQAVILDVFQYMIGNTDWSAVEFHNVKLVEYRDGTLMTVPYDFDFAGAVNARYADPDESLNLRSVKQRLYRGFCHADVGRDWAVYEEVFALFLEKREDIYALYTSLEGGDEGRMEDVLEFYDDFYEVIEDPGRIESRMIRSCRRLRSR